MPWSKYFNPRSHERSDLVTRCVLLQLYYISIHAPTRGATAASVMREESSQFQSTLPREERLLELALILIACVFQSTLPREERLTDANVQLYAKSISIHAPTRGATYSDSNANNACAISIHAPTRGATKVKKVLRRILKFQSTLPREERPKRRLI